MRGQPPQDNFGNPPYHDEKLDQRLVSQFRDWEIALATSENALRHISLVGALVDMKGVLYDCDQVNISIIARQFSEAGIPFHEQAEFHIYNLLPPAQSDFLLAAANSHDCPESFPSTDVVFICGAPNFLPESWGLDERQLLSLGFDDLSKAANVYKDSRAIITSEESDVAGSWVKSVKNLNASFVVTAGGTQGEIQTNDFGPEFGVKDNPFVTLIKTEENYLRVNGNVSGSLGFLIRNDISSARFLSQLNKEHFLGKRINEALRAESLPRIQC